MCHHTQFMRCHILSLNVVWANAERAKRSRPGCLSGPLDFSQQLSVVRKLVKKWMWFPVSPFVLLLIGCDDSPAGCSAPQGLGEPSPLSRLCGEQHISSCLELTKAFLLFLSSEAGWGAAGWSFNSTQQEIQVCGPRESLLIYEKTQFIVKVPGSRLGWQCSGL